MLDQFLQVVVPHIQVARRRRHVRLPEECADRVKRPGEFELARAGLANEAGQALKGTSRFSDALHHRMWSAPQRMHRESGS
jgi:hypothetical protein